MSFYHRFWMFMLGSIILTQFSYQVVAEEQFNQFQSFVEHTNTFSPLENAASHGALGVKLGVGAESVRLDELGSNYVKDAKSPTDNASTLLIPKLWLTKGFFFPVDVGVAYGKSATYNLSQAAGYLQWTVYEGFARPAFAVRASHSRLLGGRNFSANSSSFMGLTSWGIGVISAHIGYGVTRYSGKENFEGKNANTPKPSPIEGEWLEKRYVVGATLQLLPPFVQTVAEANFVRNHLASAALKLNVGF